MRLAVGGGGCGSVPWNFKSFALDLRPRSGITQATQCAMEWSVLRSHCELSRHVSASAPVRSVISGTALPPCARRNGRAIHVGQ